MSNGQGKDDRIRGQETVLSAEQRCRGDKTGWHSEHPDLGLEHGFHGRLKQGKLFYHVGLLLEAV